MSKSQLKAVGFLATVLALVKGGDEGKITRFQLKAIKVCNKQIKSQEDAIEGFEDTKDDLEESLQDALIGVNMDNIKSSDTLKGYIPRYLGNLSAIQDQISDVDDQIKDANDQIKKFRDLANKLA